MRRRTVHNAVLAICCIVCIAPSAYAQSVRKPPKNGFNVLGMFSKDRTPTSFFSGTVVDVDAEKIAPAPDAEPTVAETASAQAPKEQVAANGETEPTTAETGNKVDTSDLVFVGDDPTKHMLPPAEDVS
ncbi:MAG: hypothetical protein KDD44_10545, partial [Bdellovibrionales bacterium]|nr:hypothetical protein [Bdellovibrionales bacterium]